MTTSTPSSRSEIARKASAARWTGYVKRPHVIGVRGHPVNRQREYQLKLHAEGRCIACGKPKGEDPRRMCLECREADKRRRARLERRRLAREKAIAAKLAADRWRVF